MPGIPANQSIETTVIKVQRIELYTLVFLLSASESEPRDERGISETLYSATEDSLNSGLDQVWQDFEKLKIYAWDLTERCKSRFELAD